MSWLNFWGAGTPGLPYLFCSRVIIALVLVERLLQRCYLIQPCDGCSCGRRLFWWTHSHTRTHNYFLSPSSLRLPFTPLLKWCDWAPLWAAGVYYSLAISGRTVWPISCSLHYAQIGVAECKQAIQTAWLFQDEGFPLSPTHPTPAPSPPPPFVPKV